MWIEVPLIFAGGLLGSSHCLGMCGGFALAVGSQASTWTENVARQLVYTVGRLFTYATLGAFAGFAGNQLAHRAATIVNVAAVMSIVAGTFLIYQGLVSAGVVTKVTQHWRRWRASRRAAGDAAEEGMNRLWQQHATCSAAGVFSTFLTSPGWKNVFLAGLFTGLLPCGLVYGFLALSAATASLFHGALLMAVFGAGTGPLMILAGSGASALKRSTRRAAFRWAAWCVVLTGAISVARGCGFLSIWAGAEVAGCPLCP